MRVLSSISIGAAIATTLFGQGFQRQATIVGGGNPNAGSCTVEVVVDGAAEVDIRGNTASMRDLNGRQPQLLIDPEVDLAKEQVSLLPARWIVPLTTPLGTSGTGSFDDE